MDQKRTRTRDDDVPIIGDYSEAQNARLRAEAGDVRAPGSAGHAAAPPTRQPASGRPVNSGSSDAWRLDPSDIARHAQLRRSEQPSRLARAARYSAIVLVLAGAFAAYWNFDTLRQITVQAPALSALLKSLSPNDTSVRVGSAPDTAVIESGSIAGTAEPTSVSAARDPERPVEIAKVEGHAAPSTESPASESPSPIQSASAAESVATAPAAREQPPASEPETIGFALPKFTVSERDAFAAVLVVRNGGNRGPSVFTWWTSDGTAKAGSDYVDLGKVVVKFAVGEQNRVINIPIIGDAIAEPTESFFVNLAPGDVSSAEPQDRIEVVIEDDD
jgi:hypothetical protein